MRRREKGQSFKMFRHKDQGIALQGSASWFVVAEG
jgi:hypothetical protein